MNPLFDFCGSKHTQMQCCLGMLGMHNISLLITFICVCVAAQNPAESIKLAVVLMLVGF